MPSRQDRTFLSSLLCCTKLTSPPLPIPNLPIALQLGRIAHAKRNLLSDMRHLSSLNAQVERQRGATIAVIEDHFASLQEELSRLRSEAIRELEFAERQVAEPIRDAHRRCQTKVVALDEVAETLQSKMRLDPQLQFVKEYQSSLENYVQRTLATVHSGPGVDIPRTSAQLGNAKI